MKRNDTKITETEMYNLVCKQEFAWIREQLSNHIPTLIRNNFWQMLGIALGLVSLVFVIVRYIK